MKLNILLCDCNEINGVLSILIIAVILGLLITHFVIKWGDKLDLHKHKSDIPEPKIKPSSDVKD